jgi:hypothetical protein
MIKTPLALLAASAMLMTCDNDARAAENAPLKMTVTCSDDVSRGMMVLANPPKVNCKDLEMMQKFIGTGFEIGPFESHTQVVESINRMLGRMERRSKSADKVAAACPVVAGTLANDNGSWTNINRLAVNVPGVSRVDSWKAGVRSHDLDDFDSKRSAAFREMEARESTCQGTVNLNDILSGKCGNAKIKVEE